MFDMWYVDTNEDQAFVTIWYRFDLATQQNKQTACYNLTIYEDGLYCSDYDNGRWEYIRFMNLHYNLTLQNSW